MERHEAHRPNANQGNQRFWKHLDLPFSRLPMVCLTVIVDHNSTLTRNTNSRSIFLAIVDLETDERWRNAAHFFKQTGSRARGGERVLVDLIRQFLQEKNTEKQDKS